MLTSRQITRLLESYSGAGKSQGRYAEVFENPTMTDYLDLDKSARKQKRVLGRIRFIADAKNKKLYIADAYSCVHRDMLKILNLPSDFLSEVHPYVTYGEAILSGNKLKVNRSLSSSSTTSRDFNWAWIKEYFIS